MRCLLPSLLAALLLGGAAMAQTGEVRPTLRPAYEAVTLPPGVAEMRPLARRDPLPATRWARERGSDVWTRVILASLTQHGAPMVRTVPTDIDAWCPGYRTADERRRRAFWAGLISALAFHESTFRPRVAGDSGKSIGLVQIRPGTARLYKCRAQSASALRDPTENLSCAVRIGARTVARDQAVARRASGRRGGLGADWGPFVQGAKREDMRRWVSAQSYCSPLNAVRPTLRPGERLGQVRPVARP
ncbi:MAG: transglycosylase SLT domain-containing protein [Shimia sp.]